MMVRTLPVEEWHRLQVTGLDSIAPDFRDADMAPVVVEVDGEIVATGTVLRVVHFESLWIKPGSGSGVSRALLRGLVSAGKAWGKLALAQSRVPKVISILSRMRSQELPVKTYILPLED